MQKIIAHRKYISIGLAAVSVLLMLFVLYEVFTLPEKLTSVYKVLLLDDYYSAESAFNFLTLSVFVTFVFTLITITFIIYTSSKEVIYVEKKQSAKNTSTSGKGKAKEEEDHSISGKLKAIEQEVSGNTLNNGEILSKLAHAIDAMQGILYIKEKNKFVLNEGFALFDKDEKAKSFRRGEGLTGQVAAEGAPLILKNIEKNLRVVASGLGKSAPTCLVILPLVKEQDTIGIVEFSLFRELEESNERTLIEFCNLWAQSLLPVPAEEVKKQNK